MTPSLGSTYGNKVLSAMRRYRLVRQPSDLVMGDNQSKRREPG